MTLCEKFLFFLGATRILIGIVVYGNRELLVSPSSRFDSSSLTRVYVIRHDVSCGALRTYIMSMRRITDERFGLHTRSKNV